jgi:outer membrane protein OmpU
MNALSIGVNYGEYTNQGGDENEDNSGFGLAASYDLGGGLTAQLGYGSSNYGKDSADDDRDSWSLGLAMSF